VLRSDPLPGAQMRSPVAHGDRHRRAEQRGLDVGGHVIGALESVRPAAERLRDRCVEPGLEVAAHLGRGVFVERQRGRGVLDVDVEQAGLDSASSRVRRRPRAARWKPRGRAWSVMSRCTRIGPTIAHAHLRTGCRTMQ
jgi:hypothetical protein